MKARLVKNGVYAVIIAIVLVVASRTYEGRSSYDGPGDAIQGETKLERMDSLARVANKRYGMIGDELFAIVHFIGYETKSKTWRMSMFIAKTTDEMSASMQNAQRGQGTDSFGLTLNNIREFVFVEGSKVLAPESKNLSLVVTFLDGFRAVYSTAQADAIATIKDPEGWTFFVDVFTDPVQVGEELGEFKRGEVQQ